MSRVVIVQNSIRTTYLFRVGYIKSLIERSITVVVIAPNDDRLAYDALANLGVILPEVKTGTTLLSRLRSISVMNFYIMLERLKYSPVILCHFLVTFITCFITIAPFNKKLIVYTEGLGSIFTNKKLARSILRFFLTKSNCIRIFCNSSERSMIGKKDDLVSHGIGIQLSKFQPIDVIDCKASHKFELLYLGRLVADKGFFDSISVLRKLRERGYDVALNIVGDFYPSNPTSINENDKKLLQEEFGEHICFVGFSQDVRYWYSRSNVLLLPSVREGFPVSVMEASSMGIPTVGYKVPGMVDAVKDGINGKLVDLKDVSALIKATEELLNDVRSSQMLSKLANEYAKENFERKDKDDLLLKIIEGLF